VNPIARRETKVAATRWFVRWIAVYGTGRSPRRQKTPRAKAALSSLRESSGWMRTMHRFDFHIPCPVNRLMKQFFGRILQRPRSPNDAEENMVFCCGRITADTH
jgi:hypothetical protein